MFQVVYTSDVVASVYLAIVLGLAYVSGCIFQRCGGICLFSYCFGLAYLSGCIYQRCGGICLFSYCFRFGLCLQVIYTSDVVASVYLAVVLGLIYVAGYIYQRCGGICLFSCCFRFDLCCRLYIPAMWWHLFI